LQVWGAGILDAGSEESQFCLCLRFRVWERFAGLGTCNGFLNCAFCCRGVDCNWGAEVLDAGSEESWFFLYLGVRVWETFAALGWIAMEPRCGGRAALLVWALVVLQISAARGAIPPVLKAGETPASALEAVTVSAQILVSPNLIIVNHRVGNFLLEFFSWRILLALEVVVDMEEFLGRC
jgi:hypothetical protein